MREQADVDLLALSGTDADTPLLAYQKPPADTVRRRVTGVVSPLRRPWQFGDFQTNTDRNRRLWEITRPWEDSVMRFDRQLPPQSSTVLNVVVSIGTLTVGSNVIRAVVTWSRVDAPVSRGATSVRAECARGLAEPGTPSSDIPMLVNWTTSRVPNQEVASMAGVCAFCGSTGPMTREHVLGDWLSRIGLSLEPVPHRSGWLNRLGRDLGVRPPFRQTVRVCGQCNNGWMSGLEGVARRVLTPFILGSPGEIPTQDLGAIAAWVHKTVLTAMLVSSEQERADGYGLPPSEYLALYAVRESKVPLSASRSWIGRYNGARGAAVRVTPLAVGVEGMTQADQPQGYAMTVVLGQLILHGVRFTTPGVEVDLATCHELPQLWPAKQSVSWPDGRIVDDSDYLAFAAGKDLVPLRSHVVIEPWKRATDLENSRLDGNLVRLPLICGKHVAHYPLALVGEAAHQRYYAFVLSCACPMAYLIQTEPDGAHCRAAGPLEAIAARYKALPSEELEIHDHAGVFPCKGVERA